MTTSTEARLPKFLNQTRRAFLSGYWMKKQQSSIENIGMSVYRTTVMGKWPKHATTTHTTTTTTTYNNNNNDDNNNNDNNNDNNNNKCI